MQKYADNIEAQMQRYYHSLSEKDSRRYAAIEAVKLGYGGQVYIRRLFGCHHETLQLGIKELQNEITLQDERIRQSGGGRKSSFEKIDGLDEAFLRVLERYTAGSPMDETLKWTNLKRHQIAELLYNEGIEVSVTVVDKLLSKHNYHASQSSEKYSHRKKRKSQRTI